MKTVELSGTLKFQSGEWSDNDRIKLIQEDGLQVDLVARIKEATDSFGKTGQVNYWICEKPCTKDEAIEAFLGHLYGGIEAGYDKVYTYYSTLTGGSTDYETELRIGGHNLYRELKGQTGKFLIMEINLIQNEERN